MASCWSPDPPVSLPDLLKPARVAEFDPLRLCLALTLPVAYCVTCDTRQSRQAHMTENRRHLTARVPADLVDQLDDLARQRRQATGDVIRRADLVREAIEGLVSGDGRAPAPTPDAPADTADEFGAVAVARLLELADLAEREGLIDDPQGFGMEVWPVAIGHPHLDRLRAIADKLSAALRVA